MKAINKLTSEDIEGMSYNQLIGLTRETNRPPGGYKSIEKICREAYITPAHRILEIGTSTGFTAIELARTAKAQITAIDINPQSLREARHRAKRMGAPNVKFEINDATDLSYQSNSFDLVFCGNVTSYVPNRQKALSEYIRVLKDGGILAAIPMYYTEKPSKSLLKRVSDEIKFDITPEYRDDWTSFFSKDPMVMVSSSDYRFDKISDSRVEEFVADILSRKHLSRMRKDTLTTLSKKYSYQIKLFAENLSHMGYTIMLLRKEPFKIDQELFTGTKLKTPYNDKI